MGELKYIFEVYTMSAGDAAGTSYVQRNFTPVGIKHAVDEPPTGCDSPQRWKVKNAQVTLTDANSQVILGAQVKIGALHPNGTTYGELQRGQQGHGESVRMEAPTEIEHGFCWQIKVPLNVAGYLVHTMAAYEVVR